MYYGCMTPTHNGYLRDHLCRLHAVSRVVGDKVTAASNKNALPLIISL